MDAGAIDMPIRPSNDGEGPWFYLIGVSMVEGSTYTAYDWLWAG